MYYSRYFLVLLLFSVAIPVAVEMRATFPAYNRRVHHLPVDIQSIIMDAGESSLMSYGSLLADDRRKPCPGECEVRQDSGFLNCEIYTSYNMAALFRGMKKVTEKHPVLRGMLTYSVLWPTSNVVQQMLDKTRDKYDPVESLRYLVLGSLVTAPTVYIWVKVASKIIKGQLLRHAVMKAGLEQILFAPVGISQFYFGITLLEGRPWSECVQEWKEKFIPTWKVGMCVWPVVQTINFAYVAERNRVVVVSMASFAWTIFLSYMHHLDQETLPAFLQRKSQGEPVKPVKQRVLANDSGVSKDTFNDTNDIL